MSDDAAKRQGAMIKRYLRAKTGEPSRTREIERAGRMLEPALRARVDALGKDAEELLHASDECALTRLGDIELGTELVVTRPLNGARVLKRKGQNEGSHSSKAVGRHDRMRRG